MSGCVCRICGEWLVMMPQSYDLVCPKRLDGKHPVFVSITTNNTQPAHAAEKGE